MMKYFASLLLNIAFFSIVQGQTLAEKVASQASEYLGSILNYEVYQDSIQPSVVAAIAKVMNEGTQEEREQLETGSGIQRILKEVYDSLPGYCYDMRRQIVERNKNEFYKLSDNPEANEHYDNGNKLMNNGDYKKAIKEFKAAVKSDKNFVYAIDNIAISYRRMKKFKKAIKYYRNSLVICPAGNVALLNIAVAYSFIGDDDNSIRNYEQLRFLFPDNPEGYFGLAKMLFLKGDYGEALDDVFIAHRIYVSTQSDYVKDSNQLIGFMYEKLKDLGKTDLFNQKAKENNISISFKQ